LSTRTRDRARPVRLPGADCLLEGATEVDFAPRRLPTLLRELLRDRPPVEPIDVGV